MRRLAILAALDNRCFTPAEACTGVIKMHFKTLFLGTLASANRSSSASRFARSSFIHLPTGKAPLCIASELTGARCHRVHIVVAADRRYSNVGPSDHPYRFERVGARNGRDGEQQGCGGGSAQGHRLTPSVPIPAGFPDIPGKRHLGSAVLGGTQVPGRRARGRSGFAPDAGLLRHEGLVHVVVVVQVVVIVF